MSRLYSLLWAALLLSGLASAAAPDRLGPGDLDFYLLQAFAGGEHGQRYALNHIGIQVAPAGEDWRVSAVLEGFPAHAAGILRGDLLVAADGSPYHPVYSFNERDLAPNGFSPRGEPIELELQRQGQQISVQLRPVFGNLFDAYREATLNSVQQFPSGNKTLGYVRLWGLSRSTADLIAYRGLFEELSGTDGLILDLRDAYGFLDLAHLQAIHRGSDSLFESENQRLLASRGPYFGLDRAYRKPVAVLINGRTRAGAELLAYQLDKLSRVVTVGESSAGRLGDYRPDRAAGFSYRSDGGRIDGEPFEQSGHAPEQPVSWPASQQGRIDPQFQAAFDILMNVI